MAQRPNIIVVTTHDSGRWFGCYGIPELDTPHIDGLAQRGVLLTNYFAAVPICCASRASMMTGRYPQSHGLMDLCFGHFNWRLNDDEQHLSQILHGAGYRTALFGVQHEVTDVQRLAFDVVQRAHRVRHHETAFTIVEALGNFLRDDATRQQPFFCQVGFFESHTPFDYGGVTPHAPRGVHVPPYLERDAATETSCAALQGALHRIDEAMGQLLAHLHDSGLAENTILVFTTDHGVELPRSKWFCYDPGIAIAMMLHWPAGGIVGGRQLDWLTSNVDFVPTLLELAGVSTTAPVQGTSFASGLTTATPGAAPRQEIHCLYHKTQTRGLRTERYKYLRHFDAATDYGRVPVRVADMMQRKSVPPVELYDLHDDPVETTNRWNDPTLAAVAADLDTRLWRWLESVADPILQGPMRTPSYNKVQNAYQAWRTQQQ